MPSHFKSRLSGTLSLIVMVTGTAPCLAGLYGYYGWTREYNNGEHILVMIPSDEQLEAQYNSDSDSVSDESWRQEESVIEARELRLQFSFNGLYRNDGSHTLMWEFPNWTFIAPYVSDDGRFAVFPCLWVEDHNYTSVPNWHSDFGDFVVDGRIVASYKVEDLITWPYLKAAISTQVSGYFSEEFDNEALTYSVETKWGEKIVFDVTTGKIISHYRPIELLLLGLVLCCCCTLAGVHFFKHVRRASQNASATAETLPASISS